MVMMAVHSDVVTDRWWRRRYFPSRRVRGSEGGSADMGAQLSSGGCGSTQFWFGSHLSSGLIALTQWVSLGSWFQLLVQDSIPVRVLRVRLELRFSMSAPVQSSSSQRGVLVRFSFGSCSVRVSFGSVNCSQLVKPG
ncbi:hypothetical protein Hanom_Chr04g00304891 [Helianthus anomalus]